MQLGLKKESDVMNDANFTIGFSYSVRFTICNNSSARNYGNWSFSINATSIVHIFSLTLVMYDVGVYNTNLEGTMEQGE